MAQDNNIAAAVNAQWIGRLRGEDNNVNKSSKSKSPPRRRKGSTGAADGASLGGVPTSQSRASLLPVKAPKQPKSTDRENSIKVAVRVRPLSKQERSAKANVTIDVVKNQLVTLLDPKSASSVNDPLFRSRDTKYAFDVALDVSATNRELYEACCNGLIDKVIEGYHGTVFAYGATGSGKTYTMSGTGESNPGVMFYLISDLFRQISQKQHLIEASACYLEIYNEEIRDLLHERRWNEESTIDLREDPIKGVTVAGITEYDMESASDVFRILKEGAQRRTTDSHNLNEASSRSHAVLMITVKQYEKIRAGHARKKSKVTKSSTLTMIDLAGSERAKKTGTSKKMLREGAKINRSLLALANCINALGQAGKKKGLYIPYRDSKLTRLLKDSLGGGAHTVMIANVSCSTSQFDETRETLLYANRAKNIKVTAELLKARVAKARSLFQRRNLDRIVADMNEEISDLRISLSPTRKLSSFQSDDRKSGPSNIVRASSESQYGYAPRSFTFGPPSDGVHAPVAVRSGPNVVVTGAQMEASALRAQELVHRIVSNFQDRIQTRRSLVELEEMDALNRTELQAYETTVQEWRVQEEELIANGNSETDDVPESVQEAMAEMKSLSASLEDNEKYRKEQLARVMELRMEGAQLRRQIQSASAEFNAEREQLVHLTLDRCVLELQKMELELQQRVLKIEVEETKDEALYYKELLQAHDIDFEPYDASTRGISSALPLPAVPNLHAPNPLVRSALATPRHDLRGKRQQNGDPNSQIPPSPLPPFGSHFPSRAVPPHAAPSTTGSEMKMYRVGASQLPPRPPVIRSQSEQPQQQERQSRQLEPPQQHIRSQQQSQQQPQQEPQAAPQQPYILGGSSDASDFVPSRTISGEVLAPSGVPQSRSSEHAESPGRDQLLLLIHDYDHVRKGPANPLSSPLSISLGKAQQHYFQQQREQQEQEQEQKSQRERSGQQQHASDEPTSSRGSARRSLNQDLRHAATAETEQPDDIEASAVDDDDAGADQTRDADQSPWWQQQQQQQQHQQFDSGGRDVGRGRGQGSASRGGHHGAGYGYDHDVDILQLEVETSQSNQDNQAHKRGSGATSVEDMHMTSTHPPRLKPTRGVSERSTMAGGRGIIGMAVIGSGGAGNSSSSSEQLGSGTKVGREDVVRAGRRANQARRSGWNTAHANLNSLASGNVGVVGKASTDMPPNNSSSQPNISMDAVDALQKEREKEKASSFGAGGGLRGLLNRGAETSHDSMLSIQGTGQARRNWR